MQKELNEAGNTSNECPDSPELDSSEFPMPKEVGDDYYNELEDKINEINEKYAGLLSEADVTRQKTLAEAEGVKQEEQSAFDIAYRKSEIAKDLLDAQTLNKKSQHYRNYKQELRNAVPKNQSHTKNKCGEDVPKEKIAVINENLNRNLTAEDVEYGKKLKDINKTLAEADKKNSLAKMNYASDVCIANAQRRLDISAARVMKREDISKALADVNK